MFSRFAFVSAFLLASPASSVSAAAISLDKAEYLGAGLTHHLHIEGPIEKGDADQVRNLTQGLPEGRDAFLVVSLNSPGGAVRDALEIAQMLQAKNMQVVTDVMTRDGGPASCASACSYIYLGGSYRFLHEGSQLGVHQFYFGKDALMPLSETTALVQKRSADITRLLSDAYVDPGFFSLMGDTAPENMTWVDRKTLEQYNVLNRERAYQENEFTLVKGDLKLVMTHIGLYGVNRLTGRCSDGEVVFSSEILIPETLHDPADLSRPGRIQEVYKFVVLADGYVAPADLIAPQSFDDPALTTQFALSEERLAALLSAKSMDVRLAQESGIFVGASFDIADGKLKDLVESCMEIKPTPPSFLGGIPDLEKPLSPVLVAATLGAAQRRSSSIELPSQQVAAEDKAITLFNEYLAAWSKPNSEALAYMDSHYSDVVDFYDKELSKGQLMAEKKAFAERWPVRRYSARQDTFEIRCNPGSCLISGLIDWEAHSPSRGKTSKGIAWYGLGFDMLTGEVLFENGESRKK